MVMREKLLDAAEARMRAVGYNATSFRDIAGDVGVKSASVHYHFPHKADLGVELVKRYAARQFATLDDNTKGMVNPADRVKAMADLHGSAFTKGQCLCLCAILSAESMGLPEPVTVEVKAFFDQSLDWLEKTFAGQTDAKKKAGTVLAALQGGLLIAAVSGDAAHFARAASGVEVLAHVPPNR